MFGYIFSVTFSHGNNNAKFFSKLLLDNFCCLCKYYAFRLKFVTQNEDIVESEVAATITPGLEASLESKLHSYVWHTLYTMSLIT